tara:strand:- start:35 stop:376 length:342 start_codon:yes stop_codon:yes gene_type:complete
MLAVYRVVFFFLILLISYGAFTPSRGLDLPYIDKMLHFLAFLLLSFTLDLSSKRNFKSSPDLILVLVFYAGFIEVIQSFLSFRSAELLDFVFDLIGILVYVIFAPKLRSESKT